MSKYVLDHHLEGERARLSLMSRLLDPMHRRHVEALGIGPGARTLEVGCGNGSISAWLAAQVGPGGRAVAVDLDLSLVDARATGLELRQADIVATPIDPGAFDLVTAEPPEVRAFWDGWLAWSRDQGIDYHVGRALAPRPASLGLAEVAGTAETAVYNGASPWADYWTDTVVELRGGLVASGRLDDELIDAFLAHCADPSWWTQTIAFTAVHARRAAG